MVFRGDSLKWVIVTLTILHRVMSFNSVSANCHLSVISDSKLYNYSLDSPMPLYPHGVQSEDGYSLSLSLYNFCNYLIRVQFLNWAQRV